MFTRLNILLIPLKNMLLFVSSRGLTKQPLYGEPVLGLRASWNSYQLYQPFSQCQVKVYTWF